MTSDNACNEAALVRRCFCKAGGYVWKLQGVEAPIVSVCETMLINEPSQKKSMASLDI